jgi:nitrogen regulatory protein P-II 1
MYLILFVLDDPDKLEDLLNAWEEAGTGGATVLVSAGMNRMLNHGFRDDIPLMPGLDDFYKRVEDYHRTLFTIVKDDDMLNKIVYATQRVVGELNQPNTGILVVMPTMQVYGLEKNL